MFSSLSLSFLSIAIVNITLFVLHFLNLPQGDILTRAEKHFKELKDSFLSLPSWYQDGLNKQWKSGELILQGKGYACISPDGSNKLTHGFLFGRSDPRGPPAIETETKEQKCWEEEIPIQAMAALKISRKHHPRWHQPFYLPSWGQIKTLINKAENLISQQRIPWSPENLLIAMLALLACPSPAQAEPITHT